jgi:hypothetical protein
MRYMCRVGTCLHQVVLRNSRMRVEWEGGSGYLHQRHKVTRRMTCLTYSILPPCFVGSLDPVTRASESVS